MEENDHMKQEILGNPVKNKDKKKLFKISHKLKLNLNIQSHLLMNGKFVWLGSFLFNQIYALSPHNFDFIHL